MFTAMAIEFLQSIGFELVIFGITLVLALLFGGVQLCSPLATLGVHFGSPQRTFKMAHSKAMQNEPVKVSGGGRLVKHPSPQTLSPALSGKIASMVDSAKKRHSAEAIAMYQRMKADGEHTAIKDFTGNGKQRSVDVFGLLVQCAGSVGRQELIEVLLDDMAVAGVARSLGFYESTMRLLASKKCYKEAISVCSRLEADGLEPSSVTLSCLINFAAEIGDSDRAVEFFNRLAATSTPSIRAYMTVLRVYSRRPDWPKSLAAIRDMQHRQVGIDSLVLNVVLATGVASGDLGGAKALLQEFSEIAIADVVSYNTVLKGLAQQKETDEAMKLLDKVCESGLRPNAITFNTAMDAAVRSYRIADAWRMLQRMESFGLTPDKFTCTTLVKGLQTGATSQQLTAILDLMQNVNPDCSFTDSSSVCTFLFRSVIESTAQINDPVVTSKAIAWMRKQQGALPAQEYHRLVQVLMRDGGRTPCRAACRPAAFELMRPVGVC